MFTTRTVRRMDVLRRLPSLEAVRHQIETRLRTPQEQEYWELVQALADAEVERLKALGPEDSALACHAL